MSVQNYDHLGLLGRGSYGRVLKVRRHDDQRICVLKQIPLEGLCDKELTETINEAQVMSRISHPNVIAYYNSFVDDGMLNICMEYADAGDLAQAIKAVKGTSDAGMPEPRIWNYLVQICEGLHYLHTQRILHRDLKPSNILLSCRSERAQIADLGFGRLLGTGERWALTGVGTPLYLSPELCEERPYDDKSDMWALGCLTYEMAVLQPPFVAANQVALAEKIVRAEPREIPASFSLELQFLVSRLLEKNPRERPSAEQCLAYPAVKVRRDLLASLQREAGLRADLLASEKDRERQQVENDCLQTRCMHLRKALDAAHAQHTAERQHQNQLVDDVLLEAREQDLQFQQWAQRLESKEQMLAAVECRVKSKVTALATQGVDISAFTEDSNDTWQGCPSPTLTTPTVVSRTPPRCSSSPCLPPPRPQTSPAVITNYWSSPLLDPPPVQLLNHSQQSPFRSWDADSNTPVVALDTAGHIKVPAMVYPTTPLATDTETEDDAWLERLMVSLQPETTESEGPVDLTTDQLLIARSPNIDALPICDLDQTQVITPELRVLWQISRLGAPSPSSDAASTLARGRADGLVSRRQLEFRSPDPAGPRPSSAQIELPRRCESPWKALAQPTQRRLSRKVVKCAAAT